MYSDCSSGHGGDEADAHDCPTVRTNRLVAPDAHVCMYICTYNTSIHCLCNATDNMYVHLYSTYTHVCMYEFHVVGWLSSNQLYSTCTLHNNRDQHASHTTTEINMHPTQQQGSSACTTCDVHTIECSFTQSQSPSTITYGSTRFVESEGVGSRGYRTATQKTHHTLGVSYSEKILWE